MLSTVVSLVVTAKVLAGAPLVLLPETLEGQSMVYFQEPAFDLSVALSTFQ